jgi:hypothetical protein
VLLALTTVNLALRNVDAFKPVLMKLLDALWPVGALSLAVEQLNMTRCDSIAVRKEWYVQLLMLLDLPLRAYVTSLHQVQFNALSKDRIYKQRAVHDFEAAITRPGSISRCTKSDGRFHRVKFSLFAQSRQDLTNE